MKLGVVFAPVTNDAGPNELAQRARAFEAEGFSSIWSAQAIGRGFMMTDPLLALAVAATATETVEIGTAILQVPLYHPVDLAHRVLSLMQICGDRLILGVGAGSTVNDFDAFDRDHAARFTVFSEHVARLRELFAAGREGGVDLSPWSAVAGGPPLFLGSWGDGVEQAARDFDGWIASAAYRTPEQVIDALGRYRQAGGARAVVSTIRAGPDTDLGELGEVLGGFAEAGFDDAVLMPLPGAPPPGTLRALVR